MNELINEKNVKAGESLLIKIMNRWRKFEVISIKDDWIEFKLEDGKKFTLNTLIHVNHIKLPKSGKKKLSDTKKEIPVKKLQKKTRKPRQKSKS